MGPPGDRIPWFDENGNLPPGAYHATLEDIEKRFTWNAKRLSLFRSLKRALANLAAAGVRRVWIDGSFVTAKQEPKDVDGCWEFDSRTVDPEKLDDVFVDPDPLRRPMWLKYGVDFFIAGTRLANGRGHRVEEYFQKDPRGNPKGILVVDLGGTP